MIEIVEKKNKVVMDIYLFFISTAILKGMQKGKLMELDQAQVQQTGLTTKALSLCNKQ